MPLLHVEVGELLLQMLVKVVSFLRGQKVCPWGLLVLGSGPGQAAWRGFPGWAPPPAVFTCALCSRPAGFIIYFGYGLWHSEEASLAADQARTPDGNLDHCK